MTAPTPPTGGAHTPGPLGGALDKLARKVGGWSKTQMVYAVEIIGEGEDPQVLLTGSDARWMPRASRWSFSGFPPVRAVIKLSQYRAAILKATSTPPLKDSSDVG